MGEGEVRGKEGREGGRKKERERKRKERKKMFREKERGEGEGREKNFPDMRVFRLKGPTKKFPA